MNNLTVVLFQPTEIVVTKENKGKWPFFFFFFYIFAVKENNLQGINKKKRKSFSHINLIDVTQQTHPKNDPIMLLMAAAEVVNNDDDDLLNKQHQDGKKKKKLFHLLQDQYNLFYFF